MDTMQDGALSTEYRPKSNGLRTAPDGRSTRWTAHRQARRQALTEAAITAIRQHGAAVGMDEIAAVAGTSKTVIYRHLGDRLGLYLAVCEAVDAQIMSDLHRALQSHEMPRRGSPSHSPRAAPAGQGTPSAVEHHLLGDPGDVLVAVIDAYLHLVEKDPEVYRFVVRRPLLDVPPESDPVAGLTDAIADTLGEIFARALRAAGRDTTPATIWAHGLIGFVREAADRWLNTPDREPREVIASHLADFAAVGLTGVLNPRSEAHHD